MNWRIQAIVLAAGLCTVTALLSPLLARVGHWTEVRRWECANPAVIGYDHAVYLSVEELYSTFDLFQLYSTHRVRVSDGGYSYGLYFEVPSYPARVWIEKCSVVWTSDGVRFISSSGLAISISKDALHEQLGE